MTWNGWFEYDGNEIINVTRTEQYAKNLGATWLRPQFRNDVLPFMLGDGLRYSTPLLDDAPWVDEDAPESLDFWGLYPLDVTGLEDSSRTSTVLESLGEGGFPGQVRNATKAIVFSGVLVAATEAAADYGMRWLKQALNGGACNGNTPQSGGQLCYLSSPPDMDLPELQVEVRRALSLLDGGHPTDLQTLKIDGGGVTSLVDEVWGSGGPNTSYGLSTEVIRPRKPSFDPGPCLDPYYRTMRNVGFNTGPTITSKRTLSDGSAVWSVTFTGVAGNPWELGAEVPVILGFLDPHVTEPYVGGERPEGGAIDLTGYIADESLCAVKVYDPIYDPLAPALIAPPSVPTIPLGTYNPPKNWRRRQFTIPKSFVPAWGEVVPKVSVHARKADLRNLRLRFYADPFKIGDISDDPCAYCGDIVISYLPVDHSLILDGAEQTVRVIGPGGETRRADSLVFKTDGTPFEWPSLACGFGYIVTVDLPQTQEPPVVDLSLFPRAV